MRDLDEEDGVRSQEQALLEEQQLIGTAQSLGATGVLDWSAILSGSTSFDFGGTGGEVAESSSNA